MSRLKKLVLYAGMLLFASCSSNADQSKLQADIAAVQSQNDSLKKQIGEVKLGLGDLMLMVQVHHNKL